jgi:predicted XRE-type DNA-binding protein
MSNAIKGDKENAARVKNVRLWIKESGLKQTHVCKKVGVKYPSYLSQMIGVKAFRKIPMKLYAKLEHFLNLH